MATFTERMQTLTNELSTSRKERGEVVVEIREHTGRVLTDARALVKRLGDGHRSMATDCRSELSAHRQQVCKDVQSFRAKACQELHDTRERLHAMLGRSQKERQEKLTQMTNGFREAQQELRKDLQEAARAWHQPQQREPSGN